MMTDIRHYPFDTWWGPLDAHGDPDDDLFDAPLQWDEPTVARVDGLFEPNRDFEVIAAVYGVMAAANQHTFQLLTEHPERAGAFFEWADGWEFPRDEHEAALCLSRRSINPDLVLYNSGNDWPPQNVWLGTRASDQSEADARIPPLLECPAAGRFVELAPLEGAVDLQSVEPGDGFEWTALGDEFGRATYIECGCSTCESVYGGQPHEEAIPSLDWIIAAGDTGPEAEPCDIDWMRAIRDQCESAGVPLYIQQLGSRPAMNEYGADGSERLVPLSPDGWGDAYDHPHGADPSEWPEGLRVREMPEGVQP